MAMKNKYAYRSKISEDKIRQIVKLFAVDLDASQIAEVTSLNRNTINRYLAAFRERIAQYCEAESPVSGEVEVDESYFGARRVRGIRGRGARGKTIVFGLFKRNGPSTPKSCPTVQKLLSRASSEVALNLRALFTLTVGVAMMVL